ncbi:MAG: hypothetical protein AAGA18_01960 [Verrucomicrobiota bacterium]
MKRHTTHILSSGAFLVLGLVCGFIIPSKKVSHFFFANGKESGLVSPDYSSAKPSGESENSNRTKINKGIFRDDRVLSEFKASLRMKTDFQRLQGVYSLLENVDQTQLPMLLGQMVGIDSSSSETIERAIMAKWVELDPNAALQYVISAESRNSDEWTSALFQTWVELDEVSALAAVTEIGDRGKRRRAQSAVIEFIAKSDHSKAIEVASRFVKEGASQWLYFKAIESWSKTEPMMAAEQIKQLAFVEPWAKKQMLSRIAGQWAETNRQAALSWVQGQVGDPFKGRMLRTIMGDWAETLPQKAAAFLLDMDKSQMRSEITAEVVETWAEKDPKDAAQWVMDNTQANELMDSLETVVEEWVLQDSESATEFALGLEPGPLRNNALSELLKKWLDHDVEKAVEWVKTIPLEDEAMKRMLQSSVWKWGRKDPKSAAAFAAQLPDGRMKNDFAKNIVEGWASSNIQEALTWAESLGESGNGAVIKAISSWTEQNPAEAARYVESITDDKLQKRGIREVINQWGEYDPGGAANWLMQFKEDERLSGVSSLAYEWLRSDVNSAMDWIDAMPYGPSRDAGVENIIDRFYESDPEGAFAWAKSIASDKSRYSKMERVARKWLEQDEGKARVEIENSSLPDEVKSRLLGS